MLTRPIAGGMTDSRDPEGRCKGIRDAGLAKATGGDAINQSKAGLTQDRRKPLGVCGCGVSTSVGDCHSF